MVSRKLREAIKLHEWRAYQIAHEAGVHPATLSKILNGIEKVQPGDARVLAIGGVLGLLESELFEEPDSGEITFKKNQPALGTRQTKQEEL